jgi:hypothetical protein
MADLGLPDEQIKEILDYKERAYRLVAQVRRHSAAQIASMLVEATDHVKGFERILGDASESIGFEVERLGQTGEPEGVATALITASPGDQKVLYRFTYDAKSSVSGKASTHNVGISGLARHKKDHNAEHALVVVATCDPGEPPKPSPTRRLPPRSVVTCQQTFETIQGGSEKCWWRLAPSLSLEPATSRTSLT